MTNGKDKHSGPNWDGFGGYSSPNFTPVPDQLFDEQLAYLSGGELKVLLYIIRRTFGFKKESDNISLSQMLSGIERRDGTVLDRGVGLSKKTLLQALKDLQVKNLIFAARRQSQERGNEPTCYSLHMASGDHGGKTTLPLGEKLHQGGGGEITPRPRGKNSPIQETGLQETAIQEISPSNLRKAKTDQSTTKGAKRSRTSAAEQETVGDKMPSMSTPAVTGTEIPGGSGPGFSSVGTLLADRHKPDPRRTRRLQQKRSDEDRQQILAFIEDFAREFNDEAPLASSVSRAYNLCQRSGIPVQAFTSLMYEARVLTKEHSAGVTKISQTHKSVWGPEKNKMAYYFAILTQLVEQHSPKQPALLAQPGSEMSEEDASTAVVEPPSGEDTPKDNRQRSRKTLSDASESSTSPVSVSRRPIRRSVSFSRPIGAFIEDIADELGEQANGAADVDQVMELYAQSGLSEAGFLQTLAVVRTITIGSQGGNPRLPLFFTTLRRQLGLMGEQQGPEAPA
jgi:hypothetical protein